MTDRELGYNDGYRGRCYRSPAGYDASVYDTSYRRGFDAGVMDREAEQRTSFPPIDSTPDDARRLSACVAACEGIPTKALEAGIVGMMVDLLAVSPTVTAGLMRDMEGGAL